MFTNMWLLDCLGKAMPGSMPDMVNADGDDLVFHRIVFPLAKGVIGKSVVRRLNAAQWLEPASDTFWNWLAPVTKKRKPRTTKGGQAFVTTMEDGTPVFANVELAGRKLIVEVNSAARAEQAIAQMSEWLGDCVSTPMTEIRTLAQFMADDAARAPQEEPLDIPPNEMERIVHEMLTREYTKTLDEAVPALGNKTPRALARTKAGFRIERALAAPLPERQHVAGIIALGRGRQFEHRAVEGGAIVVGQIDQAGFLDEAAQLYEMAGAFAAATTHPLVSVRRAAASTPVVACPVRRRLAVAASPLRALRPRR
jgi:hypothetical protein